MPIGLAAPVSLCAGATCPISKPLMTGPRTGVGHAAMSCLSSTQHRPPHPPPPPSWQGLYGPVRSSLLRKLDMPQEKENHEEPPK